MEGKHILAALDGLQLNRLLPEGSQNDEQILAQNSARKRLQWFRPAAARTEEERISN
jgi:hypothetical protein